MAFSLTSVDSWAILGTSEYTPLLKYFLAAMSREISKTYILISQGLPKHLQFYINRPRTIEVNTPTFSGIWFEIDQDISRAHRPKDAEVTRRRVYRAKLVTSREEIAMLFEGYIIRKKIFLFHSCLHIMLLLSSEPRYKVL
jgi:hypothetical protein